MRGACWPTIDSAAVALEARAEARVREETREEIATSAREEVEARVGEQIATLHKQVAQLEEEARQRVLAGGGDGGAGNGCRPRAATAAAEIDVPPPRARHSVSTPNSLPLKHLLNTPHPKRNNPSPAPEDTLHTPKHTLKLTPFTPGAPPTLSRTLAPSPRTLKRRWRLRCLGSQPPHTGASPRYAPTRR
jgi:hypothetical protein